ncbi:response regulator transcription factor [Streptomyces sp. NPDC048479]|uniref:helix-turn-helix transcriptional regulator n=1 Tax=Streptomyces sp. NPDC048479 TaxID=3154725 RepID=UPI00341A811C
MGWLNLVGILDLCAESDDRRRASKQQGVVLLGVSEIKEREICVRRVVVAIGNGLLRYGVERMLQLPSEVEIRSLPGIVEALTDGLDEGDILIALLGEVDDAMAAELRRNEERGVRIMLLIEDDDLVDLPKVTGIRAGFVKINGINEDTLNKALAAVARGNVPIPPELAQDLLLLATRRNDAPRGQLRLTPREQEALVLMVEGLSNRQIARRLQISEHGAKRLVANILAKMDCNNRTLAVSRAPREGLYERYVKSRGMN